MMLREILSSILLLAGSGLTLIATIGILKFPDVLCRAHALTKAMTLGITLLLLALWISLGQEVGLKVLLAVGFQFLTIPISGHLLGLIVRKKRFPAGIRLFGGLSEIAAMQQNKWMINQQNTRSHSGLRVYCYG